MDEFKKLAAFISSEFDKYLLYHPEFEEKIKRNSIIIFRIDGEERFNRWHEEISLKYRERNQPVTYVHIKQIQTISALKDAEVETAAL